MLGNPVGDGITGAYPMGGGSREGDACTVNGALGRLRRVGNEFVCVPIKEVSMSNELKTDSPTVVLDGFGRLAGSRPGHCYLHSGSQTVDHAAQVTAEMNCRNARDEMIQEMTDAWKQSANTSDREVPRKHSTGDAVRDAYLDSVEDLTTSWARGSGPPMKRIPMSNIQITGNTRSNGHE